MSRIDNLGDYNIARDSLKAAKGSWDNLYKSIADTEVAKKAPKLILIGVAAGVIIYHFGQKGINLLKDRKSKLANEAALKEELKKAVEAEDADENEEIQDSEG